MPRSPSPTWAPSARCRTTTPWAWPRPAWRQRPAIWPSASAPKGIRANAISAGPIKTLAASGIGNLGKLLAYNAHNAPLRRNVTVEEVGNAAAFLLSDLASGITGEIMYVDGGMNTTALGNPEPLPG